MSSGLVLEQRRDPWESFRFWVAITVGVYAIRAAFVATWPGAIPGFVLGLLVLVALMLALRALLFPDRVTHWRESEAGFLADLRDDWSQWWHRRMGGR